MRGRGLKVEGVCVTETHLLLTRRINCHFENNQAKGRALRCISYSKLGIDVCEHKLLAAFRTDVLDEQNAQVVIDRLYSEFIAKMLC